MIPGNLKEEWNKNPLKVIVVSAFVGNTAARIFNAWSAAKGRKAWIKAFNYKKYR